MQYTAFINQLFLKSARQGVPLSGTFELTARCNLRCRMCYIHRQAADEAVGREELSAGEWIAIARAARERGMLLLLLTGGEPLLRRDFPEIYRACREMGLLVSLNTNGTLLDEKMAALLAEHPPQRVNLTLYGASRETYQRLCLDGAACGRAYRAVELLGEAGIPVKLNFSATPENLGDLPAVAAYARERDLPLQTATYMFPPVRAEENAPCEPCPRLTPEEAARIRWQRERETLPPEALLRRAEAIARRGEIPAAEDECQDVPTERIRCRAGAASFWLTYRGELRPCGMMCAPSVPLAGDFAGAWERIRAAREGILVPGRCTACRYRPICEVCPAVCQAESGEFTACPDYLCRKMDAYAALAGEWYARAEKATGEEP